MPRSRLVNLLLAFGVLYGVSLLLVLVVGRQPAVPWAFLPFLLLVSLPQAVALAVTMGVLAPRFGSTVPGWAVATGSVGLGLAVTLWASDPRPWLIIAVATVLVTLPRWRPGPARVTGLSLLALVLGYATVWNLNYLLGLATADRLWDQAFIDFDLQFLRLLGWELSSYQNALPLVTSIWGFTLLENGYLLLFPELVAVVLWLSVRRTEVELARWLGVLFSAYAVGLVCFSLMPVVGPHIFYSDSFDANLRDTLTFRMMSAMDVEYRHLLAGQPLDGFGYFIALPSLHVAAATLAQRAWRPAPLLYWTFLPINWLLIASTVLLGYHYLLDLPAGLAVGLLLGRFIEPKTPVPWPRRSVV